MILSCAVMKEKTKNCPFYVSFLFSSQREKPHFFPKTVCFKQKGILLRRIMQKKVFLILSPCLSI